MKKGILFAVLILLIHYRVVVNGNKCATEDCLIANHLESEFSFASHVARMLYDVTKSQTGQTGNSNNAAVKCPQNQPFRSCLPSQNGGGPNSGCGQYKRTC